MANLEGHMANDIKTSELGTDYLGYELRNQAKAIYGAVAMPGRNPGFAVVVAMDFEDHFESHDIYLLDEFESFDLRELIHRCGVLDYKYRPSIWIGDALNESADKFIYEMNTENRLRILKDNPQARVRNFGLVTTLMLEMDQLYSYVLPELRILLKEEGRMLFLKDSLTAVYLSGIEPSGIAELHQGEYPAIEALAFAVLEMRMHYSSHYAAFSDKSNMADSYNLETSF